MLKKLFALIVLAISFNCYADNLSGSIDLLDWIKKNRILENFSIFLFFVFMIIFTVGIVKKPKSASTVKNSMSFKYGKKCPKCGQVNIIVPKILSILATTSCGKCGNDLDGVSIEQYEKDDFLLEACQEEPKKENQEESFRKIKRYQSTKAFEKDAELMEKNGYSLESQSWKSENYGCLSFISFLIIGFLIALVLSLIIGSVSFVLIGIVTLAFMLIVSPGNTLIVTYRKKEPNQTNKVLVADEWKTCPQCAEQVRSLAKICRFCRYEF